MEVKKTLAQQVMTFLQVKMLYCIARGLMHKEIFCSVLVLY